MRPECRRFASGSRRSFGRRSRRRCGRRRRGGGARTGRSFAPRSTGCCRTSTGGWEGRGRGGRRGGKARGGGGGGGGEGGEVGRGAARAVGRARLRRPAGRIAATPLTALAAPLAPASLFVGALFDLRFLEVDVLADDRVVFAEGHLLGDVARILLGHVIEAGVGGADELDLDRGRLGHDSLSVRRWFAKK